MAYHRVNIIIQFCIHWNY